MTSRDAELSPARVGFSVPKKRFRLSVHRHRIRRLMAEAWRLQKQGLYAGIPAGRQLHVFLVFTGKDIPEFNLVETAIAEGVKKLAELCGM